MIRNLTAHRKLPPGFTDLEGLTPMQKSAALEIHIGNLMNFASSLYSFQLCPGIIDESESNIIGQFFRKTSDTEFVPCGSGFFLKLMKELKKIDL